MFKIEDILIGDFTSYPEETRKIMEEYTEKLREAIKEELTRDLADKMLKDVDKSNETFMNILTEILEKGCKGYNKMPTRTLLNLFLEKKSNEDFMRLLENIN
ncbi:hypothetical protein [Candidatus Clostridium stratigraminis]|uniref:Uncharacterized protein n=1 Tax=Candidatus Clostridium stratigraminis TaxID=3381661 RepID=A0ABW8T2F6_9CLOT